MVRKHIFLVGFLVCCIHGTYSKDSSNGFTSKLSKYSIVNPQLIYRRARDIPRQTLSKESEEEALSYALYIENRKHFLHLKRNRDFLHPNFIQYSGDINRTIDHPTNPVHCYYHGEVEGYEKSVVAVSTCSGLRGVILFGNKTYGLEPVPQSTSNEHLLYLLEDIKSEPATCGVIHEVEMTQIHEPFAPGHSLTALLRMKRNLPQTHYVELVLVVDNLRYNFKKRNETAVRHEMVEMANLLDGYYKQLNIRIVLVGLEIFKEENPFRVDGSAGDVLNSFVKWRKTTLLRKIRHDIGQLIVGRPGPYGGGVLGMAFVGTVCSAASSGGINVFSGNDLVSASTVVAHEMGHNLGMNHDSAGCTCEGNSCIMAASAGGSSTFSSCSADDFETLILNGGGMCLQNQPSQSDAVGTTKCGNGLLEKGEQCDCGTSEECKTKCCDAATCKLTPGSACAQGSCCSNCQIKVAGTPCRTVADTCDLPEYCNGTSAFCPDDFYVMDGLSCLNDAAYCYEGRCQTYDYQCKHLFAPDPATKADDICFLHANMQGNLFGNCGTTSKGDPIKCSSANAMCGKVQCTNVDVNKPPAGAQVSIQIVDGSTCVNADFRLGTDVRDPAYVNPGSPCDKGKTCLDFMCVNASALLPDFDWDPATSCSGHGVYNDQGHCHCQDGWAPPNCDKPGLGGSVDSGPTQIDHSLRNGLLIFFLLVVPLLVLLVLILLYIFKRDSFNPCLKGSLTSRFKSHNGNANGPSDRSGQTPSISQPPAQVHADGTQPSYPPGKAPPISGFRYGELDYWSTETDAAPIQPNAHKQGPGVPKPIPPRQPSE